MEIWKDIKGYEGFYQVSNLGNVKSLKRTWFSKDKKGNNKICSNNEKILKPSDNGCGYLVVNLSKNNKYKMFTVHKLVAVAFVLNDKKLKCINHKDENKKNNNCDNLEWCTHKYNNNYGDHNKKLSESKCFLIDQYDLEGNFIKTWLGMRNIERELGIKNQGICSCCKGKLKTSGGYVWKYNKNNKKE